MVLAVGRAGRASPTGRGTALDQALGRSILAQIASVSAAAITGFAVYAAIVLMMRIPEARRIEIAVLGRLRRRR